MPSPASDKLGKVVSYAPPLMGKEFVSRESFSEFKDFGPAISPQHLKYENVGSAISSSPRNNWDLIPVVDGDGTWQCWNPQIITSRQSMISLETISGNEFTPEAGKVVVIEKSFDEAGVTITLADDDADVYEFSGTSMTLARIPIWQFLAEEVSGAYLVIEDVWALRLVGTGALRNVRMTALNDSLELVSVIDFV